MTSIRETVSLLEVDSSKHGRLDVLEPGLPGGTYYVSLGRQYSQDIRIILIYPLCCRGRYFIADYS
jgi:hypothetical protein